MCFFWLREMKKPRNPIRLLIVVVAIFLVGIVLMGIFLQSPPKRLYPEEVREYKGENLSSISDIEENNIIGNQLLNESTYRLTVNGLENNTKTYNYTEVINGFQSYEKIVTLY